MRGGAAPGAWPSARRRTISTPIARSSRSAAARGGPIAALADGDIIVFDVEKRRLDVELSDEEIKRRLAKGRAPEPRYTSGVFAKYAALVSSASEGAVTKVGS